MQKFQESRWKKLYEKISDEFGIEEESSRKLRLMRGTGAYRDAITFSTPRGRMKLERTVKPKVVDVKFHFSRKTNRGSYQEVEYSPTEIVEIIKLYRWDNLGNRWREVDIEKP